jgi:hypothetical protein
MKRRTLLKSIPVAAMFPATLWAASLKEGAMPTGTTVYELRVYHIATGKQAELLARFRDHTLALFAKHGMKTLIFCVPSDEPQKNDTLIYILEHPSREAATANWKDFQADPEWQSVKAKSEANGKLVEKVDSTYLTPTDFSPTPR